MNENIKACSRWCEDDYSRKGFMAQRRYPNEELLRFLGRTFFDVPGREARQGISILELGCGSGANLWMLAREGFDAHGLDLCPSAITLCRQMLDHWGVDATVQAASMTEIPYPDGTFDVVVDVLATYCLAMADFKVCLAEVNRVLKPGGLFFTYALSARSDAFLNHAPAGKIDEFTLDGIKRPGSPFYGAEYPCRFTDHAALAELAGRHGFEQRYLELVSRTYSGMAENFEFVVYVGCKAGGGN